MMKLLSPLRRLTRRDLFQGFLVWTVLVATSFVFDGFTGNEVDVLPSALQFVDNEWLPNDWYLNLDIGYRKLFNAAVGPFVSLLGFQFGAIVTRLLLYLLFSFSLVFFFRAFRLWFPIALLAAIPFLNNQSLIAGEWMVGGVETKSFAYAFVLLSIGALFRRRYLLGFGCIGAALSFHILVGLFALFTTLCAFIVINGRKSEEWLAMLKKSWVFVVTGAWGIYAVIQQLLAGTVGGGAAGWEIYVEYRVPHHVIPQGWGVGTWNYVLIFGVVLSIVTLFRSKERRLRFLSAYLLGSFVLFLIGLVVHSLGSQDLLRFYWFRFPDTIVPFLTSMLVAVLFTRVFDMGAQKSDTMRRLLSIVVDKKRTVGRTLLFLIGLGSAIEIGKGIHAFNENERWVKSEDHEMYQWISENTPQDIVVLADPMTEDFYVEAQRALVVSFKHSPQAADDIEEWYRRLLLCNGNHAFEKHGFGVREDFKRHFDRLNDEMIKEAVNNYGATHYLTREDRTLPFELLHRSRYFSLYQIDSERH